jgi:hypothetical protein
MGNKNKWKERSEHWDGRNKSKWEKRKPRRQKEWEYNPPIDNSIGGPNDYAYGM